MALERIVRVTVWQGLWLGKAFFGRRSGGTLGYRGSLVEAGRQTDRQMVEKSRVEAETNVTQVRGLSVQS